MTTCTQSIVWRLRDSSYSSLEISDVEESLFLGISSNEPTKSGFHCSSNVIVPLKQKTTLTDKDHRLPNKTPLERPPGLLFKIISLPKIKLKEFIHLIVFPLHVSWMSMNSKVHTQNEFWVVDYCSVWDGMSHFARWNPTVMADFRLVPYGWGWTITD